MLKTVGSSIRCIKSGKTNNTNGNDENMFMGITLHMHRFNFRTSSDNETVSDVSKSLCINKDHELLIELWGNCIGAYHTLVNSSRIQREYSIALLEP